MGKSLFEDNFYYSEKEEGHSVKVSIDEKEKCVEKICLKSMISIDGSKYPVTTAYDFADCEKIKHLVLEKGILDIDINCFESCKNLEIVELSDGLIKIGIGAFEECESLVSICIPDSVTTIDDEAFAGYSSLSAIKLPKKLTIVSEKLFLNCDSLESVLIPDCVERIEDSAFEATAIKQIALSKKLKYIGNGAFCNTELTSIVIPQSVSEIGDSAFEDCEDLRTIIIENSFGNITIGDNAFPKHATVIFNNK
ncbi:MAG: leucine-rich repeat domain-containing protein [Bacteroidales bacterium]|nr:leucine-rich repeat domain-containing protein [Bacteroidales bacterium]